MLLTLLKREAARFVDNVRNGNPFDLPRVQRRTGVWNHADLEWLAAKVADVPGDFAEIGVFRGDAFRRVATLAGQQRKRAHAFDSFAGMNEPTPADGGSYPKGMFDVGGPDAFAELMAGSGVARTLYELWPGYVPDSFAKVPADLIFSWAIVDLDQYQPTADALLWLPARINRGGLLALDDYVPVVNRGKLATRAIEEFLATDHAFERVALFNQHLIMRKTT